MSDQHPMGLRTALALPRVLHLAGLAIVSCLCVAAARADESPSAATSLSFADFFKHPVGPRGLEPGGRLLALAGQRVEVAGYLVRQGDPAGLLIVAPVPVVIGDEDESFADDLPASVAYLHPINVRTREALQACRGAVRVRGRIEIGRVVEVDGRQSFVRVLADAAQCAGTPSR